MTFFTYTVQSRPLCPVTSTVSSHVHCVQSRPLCPVTSTVSSHVHCVQSRPLCPLTSTCCPAGVTEWPSSQGGGDDKGEDMPTLSPLPSAPPANPTPDRQDESPHVGGDNPSGPPSKSTPTVVTLVAVTSGTPTKPLASVLPSIINMLNSPVKHSAALPGVVAAGPPKSVMSSGLVLTSGGVYSVASSTSTHHIPCLADGGCGDSSTVTRQGPVAPALWGVTDVCQFLCLNDCEAHCDSFRKKVGVSVPLFRIKPGLCDVILGP